MGKTKILKLLILKSFLLTSVVSCNITFGDGSKSREEREKEKQDEKDNEEYNDILLSIERKYKRTFEGLRNKKHAQVSLGTIAKCIQKNKDHLKLDKNGNNASYYVLGDEEYSKKKVNDTLERQLEIKIL